MGRVLAVEEALMPMTNAGMSKFVEEVGEALQVVGKALGVGGVHNPHWQGDLVQPLQLELGDVLAAVYFMIEKNDLDHGVVVGQAEKKINLFRQFDKEVDYAGQRQGAG
jgi:NTP pyrophosphatase (non-canonical NTP hydrolase)